MSQQNDHSTLLVLSIQKLFTFKMGQNIESHPVFPQLDTVTPGKAYELQFADDTASLEIALNIIIQWFKLWKKINSYFSMVF